VIEVRALRVTGVRRIEAGKARIPEPGPGEVLVETLYTGISPGTELRCMDGKHPEPFEFPYIPGYSSVGRVLARGSGTRIEEGTAAFCSGTAKADLSLLWGGHVGVALQPETNVFPLPEGVDLLEGVMAKLAAIAYHGVRLSRPSPHETVAVVGLGPIGQLSARLHALAGARVIGIDPFESRAEIARQAGVEAYRLQGSLTETWKGVCESGADVVVDATGSTDVLAEAIGLAKEKPWDDSLVSGARYLIQGSYAAGVTIPYHPAFMKEIRFFLPRDHQPRDLRAVLDFMHRGKLKARDLVSEVHAPEDAPAVYAKLRESKDSLMTAAFRWRDE
jgi:2-desacetyl-2-hydroxyethyl bacteriochlorophyllide A dehydrogenase